MRARRTLHWAVLALAPLAACSRPGSWQGTVSGHVLHVKSAIFAVGAPPPGLASLNPAKAGAIILSDAADPCSDLSTSQLSARHAYLILGLVKPGATTLPPSTYLAIDPVSLTNASTSTTILDLQVNGGAVAQLYVSNPNCQSALEPSQSRAVDGTVTLGSLTESRSATGIFELSMGAQQDLVRGAFNATWCAGIMPFLAAHPDFLALSRVDAPIAGCR